MNVSNYTYENNSKYIFDLFLVQQSNLFKSYMPNTCYYLQTYRVAKGGTCMFHLTLPTYTVKAFLINLFVTFAYHKAGVPRINSSIGSPLRAS